RRQRKAVAGAAAALGREAVAAEAHDRRDVAPGRVAGHGAPLTGRTLMSTIRALVALADGVTPAAIQAALPGDDGIEVLDWIENDLRDGRSLDTAADLVVVACSAHSPGAIALIKSAADLEPDRPVVVLQLGEAEANGFMQDVFAAGADDIISVPETPERIR